MPKNTPRVLYHYCSLSTFKSIMDSHSIWLSDISKSNDSLELQWIMGQCSYYILKAWADYAKAVQEEKGIDTFTEAHFQEFQRLYQLAKDYEADSDTKNWVFCLSEKSDDLGQWRGYADDGKGIAIGFNSTAFSVINTLSQIINSESFDMEFKRVRYSKKDIEKFFMETAGLSKITPEIPPDEALIYIKRCLAYAFVNAPFFKSEKFKDEKEWRIVYSMQLENIARGQKPGLPNAENEFSNFITLEKYGFTQRQDTLVSHLELGFPQIKRAIHSITIGPKAKVSPMDIRMYLMSIGLLDNASDKSIEVRCSSISYR